MKQLLLIIIVTSTFYTNAQRIVRNSINSAGNVENNSSIKLSQTIGQSANFSVLSHQNLQLRQGFQQVQNTGYSSNNKQLKFSIYPNPNHGDFTVLFDKRVGETLYFRLFDNLGKICKDISTEINGQKQNLHFKLPTGIYFLNITDNQGNSGVSKVIILN